MELDPRVSDDRRKELEGAREAARRFDVLMGEGNLIGASRALEKAAKLMAGDAGGWCGMCGDEKIRHEVCNTCFFMAHQEEKRDKDEGSPEDVLTRCLLHFMYRGNQQGDLQDRIKKVLPDWKRRVSE